MIKKLLTLIAFTAAVIVLAGCGDEPQYETRTAANGDEFNDADVAFATDMIPHHAQALQMVDMTIGRELDPKVQRIAEQIRAAQVPEIERLAGWLMDWDEPVPETVRDHAHAHGEGGAAAESDMPGMMDEDQLSDLEEARGGEFQSMWLEMMIDHHRGAVEMAQTEQDAGTFGPAIDLAESIEESQQAEITEMQQLLES